MTPRLSVRGNFVEGQFRRVTDATGELVLKSPADFSDELGRLLFSYSSIGDAVHAARRASEAWRVLPATEKVELVRQVLAALTKRSEFFIEIAARELGRPLWDGRREFAAVLSALEEIMAIPAAVEHRVSNVEVSRHRPIGVCAVIGSFSHPLLNGMLQMVPCLLAGNTVIYKPSERAALCGQLIAECFEESAFPPGVFALVQGDRELGRRLCVHEDLNGILFQGSYETGTRIKQDTLQQHWKTLVLQMSAKNPAIIWSDADIDAALRECFLAGFGSAGQSCLATSRVIVHSKLADRFVEELHARAKAFSIGHPLDEPFMGPLIDQGAVDRYMKFIGIASREGCEIVMRGKALDVGKQGNYVAPSICLVKTPSLETMKKSVYQQSEIFAPNVAVIPAESIEEAIAYANATQFGLTASVYCRDQATYHQFREGLCFGAINWNKPTTAYSFRLPFGGLKKSGNHFPWQVGAGFCTLPVSSLESAELAGAKGSLWEDVKGLNWK